MDDRHLFSFVEMTIVTHRFFMPRWLGALLQLKPFFTMERISTAWKKVECVGTCVLNMRIEYAGYARYQTFCNSRSTLSTKFHDN